LSPKTFSLDSARQIATATVTVTGSLSKGYTVRLTVGVGTSSP
jgi:hypothetical protein